MDVSRQQGLSRVVVVSIGTVVSAVNEILGILFVSLLGKEHNNKLYNCSFESNQVSSQAGNFPPSIFSLIL